MHAMAQLGSARNYLLLPAPAAERAVVADANCA